MAKWKTTLAFAPVTSAQLNRGGLREGSTIRLVVKPPVGLGTHHGRNCACVRACNSYTTKNFRAQHPAPDALPPRWHQKDAEKLQVAEMTAGCMAWHLWLWKLLARQFSKFQSPFTLFKIILPSPLPCSQCCSRRGLEAIDATLVTHPIPLVT